MSNTTYYPIYVKMKIIYSIAAVLILGAQCVFGQTSKEEVFQKIEKTGGVYYAYPVDEIQKQTPAPKGYEPFYISHFGRHGSRYLISDDTYKNTLDLLEDAYKKNALTGLGVDTYKRLQEVWKEVEWHGGDLSPLGVREHRGIAERMYNSFPEVFTNNVKVSARSTTIVRCVLSMDAFCERLKELSPTLQMTRESSVKYQRYLNHHTKEAIAYRSAKNTWREQYRKFEESHIHPDRLINSLFSDNQYVLTQVNPREFMLNLYEIAGGMQNIETDLTFYDLFEKQELFDLWQRRNYKVYVNDANCALNGGIMFENCKPVLRNILESADEVIKAKDKGATLRFAHDGNIIPLAMLLHLKDCYNSESDPAKFYQAWSDFKVAPMAANIQIVFFRNKKNADDIIVKFMLNENEIQVPPVKSDILPYYHWKDIKGYYESLLN